MSNENLTPVILAGGSGSRLWPLSRSSHPKQFLKISSGYTMLQEALARLKGLEINKPIVICNEEHRFLVAEQTREIGIEVDILLEPIARDTAPAICASAKFAQSRYDNTNLLVLSADHHIESSDMFIAAVKSAIKLADSGYLTTFGVTANEPNTGYGYIEVGSRVDDGFIVRSFKEKPNKDAALKYIEAGHLWNSGMFLFNAESFMEELGRYCVDLVERACFSVNNAQQDLDFIRLDSNAFGSCPKVSIDYALMEKTDKAATVELDAGWSDVGSFDSMVDVLGCDKDGNSSKGDTILVDSRDCFVSSESKLVVGLGLENLIVVDTNDALLVMPKARAQEVKEVVEMIKSADRPEWNSHREVARPWGTFDSIDEGQRFKVKRIKVKPGAKLSVQMHHHRAEHWIVVRGTARVTNGDDIFLVSENESTYIPVGQIHALENPGKVELEIIEVQTGSYLGEDDIVRFQDRYGRASSDGES